MSKDIIFPVLLSKLDYENKTVTLVGEINMITKEAMEVYDNKLIEYFGFLKYAQPVITEGTYVDNVTNIYSLAPNIANTIYTLVGENNVIIFEPVIYQGKWDEVFELFRKMYADGVKIDKPSQFKFV